MLPLYKLLIIGYSSKSSISVVVFGRIQIHWDFVWFYSQKRKMIRVCILKFGDNDQPGMRIIFFMEMNWFVFLIY